MERHEAFDHVVAALHEATIDDTRWPAASALVDEALGICGNGLLVGRESGNRLEIFSAAFYVRGRRRKDLEPLYLKGCNYPDGSAGKSLRRLPGTEMTRFAELWSAGDMTSPQADGQERPPIGNGLPACMDGRGEWRVLWVLAGPVRPGGWDKARLELAERLVPHVRQFVRVRQASTIPGVEPSPFSGLPGQGRFGVMQVDWLGRIVDANAFARRLLRRGDLLCDRGGVVGPRRLSDAVRFQELLAGILRPVSAPAASGWMTIRHSSGRPLLILRVTPVPATPSEFRVSPVVALVVAVDPLKYPRVDAAHVAKTLGLTQGEARVAAMLSEGFRVREIAARTGRKEWTIRMHVKNVLRKVGLSGQVELVQLVWLLAEAAELAACGSAHASRRSQHSAWPSTEPSAAHPGAAERN